MVAVHRNRCPLRPFARCGRTATPDRPAAICSGPGRSDAGARARGAFALEMARRRPARGDRSRAAGGGRGSDLALRARDSRVLCETVRARGSAAGADRCGPGRSAMPRAYRILVRRLTRVDCGPPGRGPAELIIYTGYRRSGECFNFVAAGCRTEHQPQTRRDVT